MTTRKAIILTGGESDLLQPLNRLCPTPMLPFLNQPLLETQLRALQKNGFTDVGIALPLAIEEQVSARIGDGKRFGLQITYASDPVPRGPAGCLRLFRDFIGKDPFLVVNGTVYLQHLDLDGFVQFHVENGFLGTLGIQDSFEGEDALESIRISDDGRVHGFHILHPSRDRRRGRRFSGIYMFESEILEFIRTHGFHDIKEQLLAEVRRTGGVVVARPVEGFHANIRNTWDYFVKQQDILRLRVFNGNGENRIREDLWIERGTEVPSSSYILGPVSIGKNCVIEDYVQIIGPAVIGDHCRIGKGSLVRESILWAGAEVRPQSRIQYRVMGPGLNISFDSIGHRARGIPSPVVRGRRGVVTDRLRPSLGKGLRRLATRLIKRATDVMAASLGLVLCLPLFVIVALAIKMDSPGPVFFRQKRCGKNGAEFRIIKFRTMLRDAEKKQAELFDKKDVDGPMFKMREDPRLTRVGRFLRKTSLDELPQLVNVLKGEMSLVGPRPLAMQEMRFSPSWRDLRLQVKPGITGLWQINGRSRASFHDWIRYDVYYVRNQSLKLDLEILAKTAKWVVARIGAY